VYNIPQHEAIDVIDGRSYFFIGDSLLLEEGFLQSFHLMPSRILHRIFPAEKLSNIDFYQNLISSNHKTILLIDKPFCNRSNLPRIKVDLLIITQNPDILIGQLAQQFDSDQYIFDASNPLWKINKWKKECENLHLRHYSIPEQGAFMMEL
jgi:competence protein ComEC